MKRIALLSVVTVTATLASTGAYAQANRTFVSGFGSDANPCTLPAPCRSFAQAVTQTNPGGEITVLDSAGYGPVTITQSLTITNPGGVEAGITAASGQDAITINTAAAATITLRGLTIEGGNAGGNGINLVSTLPNTSDGGTLNLIGCVIKDFTGNGIVVHPSMAATGTIPFLNLVIADSFFLNNGTNGIKLAPAGVFAQALIARTIVSGNSVGIRLTTSAGGSVDSLLVASHVDQNTTGISLSSGASIILKTSTVTLSSLGGEDILNNSVDLRLQGENTIRRITNNGEMASDGTNNVGSISGNAPTKLTLR
jgi:hypothetical protein